MHSIRSLRQACAPLVALTLLSVVALPAQTIFSTFGPGSTYLGGGGYPATSSENFFGLSAVADGFVYTGVTGKFLSTVRFASFSSASGSINVEFLHGSSITTATVLESWTVAPAGINVSSIYALSSVGSPALTNGDTYWVELLSAPGSTGVDWVWDRSPTVNVGAFQFGNGVWQNDGPGTPATAFDVSVSDLPNSTTPEPATLAMLATGLVAIGGVARRRKR